MPENGISNVRGNDMNSLQNCVLQHNHTEGDPHAESPHYDEEGALFLKNIGNMRFEVGSSVSHQDSYVDIPTRSTMPGIAKVYQPQLPRWQRPEKTSHDLPWADIRVLDLAKFDDENGGKERLVEELRSAVSEDPTVDRALTRPWQLTASNIGA